MYYRKTFHFFIILFSISCQNQESKSDEKTSDKKTETGKENEKPLEYVDQKPCSFSVKLPVDFEITPMYEEEEPNADYCDYEVKTPGIFISFEVHSQLKSRFENTEIDSLYKAGLLGSPDKTITYKMKKDNWFVISGQNIETPDFFYWKRVAGENFISDMYVVYEEKDKKELEKYIEEIGKSFESD